MVFSDLTETANQLTEFDTELQGPTSHGSALVNLVINQDHVAQNWIKFLVTVQAGLAFVFAFFIKAPEVSPGLSVGVARMIMVCVPLMGLLSSISLTLIVVQERKWQAWYISKFNEIPGNNGVVFPANYGKGTTTVFRQPLDAISWNITVLGSLMTLIWVVLLIGQMQANLNVVRSPSASVASERAPSSPTASAAKTVGR